MAFPHPWPNTRYAQEALPFTSAMAPVKGSDWILGKDVEMDMDFDLITHMGFKPFTEKMEVSLA